MNLVEETNKKKYDYKAIFSHKDFYKDISSDERELNFFIAVKDRTEYLRCVCQYVLQAIAESKHKIKLFVVEHNNSSINKDFCKQNGIDYIFIPIAAASTENLHSTSLMYNSGYLLAPKTVWNIFHCCDVIIPNNFFNVLFESYIEKRPNLTWLQPFSDMRLKYFTEDISQKLMNKKIVVKDFADCFKPVNKDWYYSERQPGAPGGCILVKNETFEKIGGYDPELFYGHCYEDAFFWTKLECSAQKVDKFMDCHIKSDVYANNPKMILYHLNHGPIYKQMSSSHHQMWEKYNHFLRNITYEKKMEYINNKARLFKEQIEILSKPNETPAK